MKKRGKWDNGWKRCGNDCHICPFTAPNSNKDIGLASKYFDKMDEKLSCDTSKVIYYWKSPNANINNNPKIRILTEPFVNAVRVG